MASEGLERREPATPKRREEAKKKGRVSGREIESVLENIIKSEKLSGKKDLEQALKRRGLSLGKFKEVIKDEILIRNFAYKLNKLHHRNIVKIDRVMSLLLRHQRCL